MTEVLTDFEFNLFLVLTIIAIITIIVLTLYLLKRVLNEKKKTGHISYNFVFSLFILMVCLLISRLIFFYWDFFLTKYDYDKYFLYPNIIYWKVGMFIAFLGYANLLFTIDKKAFDFKFKGILAYIIVASGLFILLYPINSPEDFNIVSIVFSIASLIGIVIPILFIIMGFKTQRDIRKGAFMFALGVILYLVSMNFVNTSLLELLGEMYGSQMRITMFFLFIVFQVSGLILCTYGAIKIM